MAKSAATANPPAQQQKGRQLTAVEQREVARRERAQDFRALLDRMKGQFANALPKHLTAERMCRVAVTAVQRTPALLDCTSSSLVKCITEASQLGLEPDGILGFAYLVPFKNKHTQEMEAQLIPGYKGLIDLCRRSGQLITISADLVYRADQFKFRKGLEPILEHVPNTSGEANDEDIIAVYGIARLKDAGLQFEVMWRSQVEKIRARSKAADNGPWVTDYGWMAKKTCLRQLCKLLPMSVEYRSFAERDEPSEALKNEGFLDITPAAIGSAKADNGMNQLTDRLESETNVTAACNRIGFTGDQQTEYLQSMYGVATLTELSAEQLDAVGRYVANLEAQE